MVHFIANAWGSASGRLKIITAVAGALASVLGAIAAFAPAVEAWDNAGLPTFAMRAFVRDQTAQIRTAQAQTSQQISSLQIDLAQGKRDQNLTARNKLELDALRYTSETEKLKAAQEIRRLDELIAALDEQIRALRAIRGRN